MSSSIYRDRLDRVRKAMADQGVDVLLVSVGHDLPYLSGYMAMPLERLTMLVVPRDGDATMVIPRLEAPRVVEQPGVFSLLPWDETEDPTAIVARLAAGATTAAVGDQMWARFLVELLPQLPGTEFRRAVDVVGPLRMVKDAAEIAALRAAGAAADRVADQLHGGQIPLVGRTEAQVSADISARLIAEGHDKVNFAIVAAGANAASPHHHAGDRVIERGEIVLCDFGGTMDGYCSDTTRCVFTGDVAGRDRRGLRRAARGPGGQRRLGGRRHAVRGGRPGGPRHHRRRRLRRAVRPPHRPRHRHGGARGPLHRRRATTVRSRPATPSASSPASTSGVAGGCAWRTSSSPRPPGRRRSTCPTTASSASMPDVHGPVRANFAWSGVGEYAVMSILTSAASIRANGPPSERAVGLRGPR